MEEQQHPSEHEQQELERKRHEEARAAEIARVELKKKLKQYAVWAIVLLVIGGVFWWGYTAYKNRPAPYTSGPIHWHALVDLEMCGQHVNLINAFPGSPMIGPMLTHTHGDNKIHIEGQIWKKEDIALGTFMDGIKAKFSETQIKDKRNGDTCPDGNAGTVTMFVNDQPNTEFRNYIPADGDTIKIVFGPR